MQQQAHSETIPGQYDSYQQETATAPAENEKLLPTNTKPSQSGTAHRTFWADLIESCIFLAELFVVGIFALYLAAACFLSFRCG